LRGIVIKTAGCSAAALMRGTAFLPLDTSGALLPRGTRFYSPLFIRVSGGNKF
jgi:hypothetical protein